MPQGTKEQIKNQRIRRKNRTKDYLAKSKLGCSCYRCGYNKHIEILQYHHKESKGKIKEISSMVTSAYSIKTIANEISKCILLCPNCHALFHLRYGTIDFPNITSIKF